MSDLYRRQPMSPAEFDAACRRLETLCPEASCVSGFRSVQHNVEVGGSSDSKHLYAMARDYRWRRVLTLAEQTDLEAKARLLGLWAVWHKGHLHVQGLPIGPPEQWWRDRWLGPKT